MDIDNKNNKKVLQEFHLKIIKEMLIEFINLNNESSNILFISIRIYQFEDFIVLCVKRFFVSKFFEYDAFIGHFEIVLFNT